MMKTQWLKRCFRSIAGASAAAILLSSPVWGQANVPPPSPDASSSAEETKDAAKEAADDATDAAKEAAKDTKEAAKETAKDVKDAAEETKEAAKETKTDAKEAAKKATRDTREAAKETKKDVKDAADRAAESTRKSARDTQRSAKEATRRATETADEAAKDATDTAEEATRDATDTARDSVRGARDTAKEAVRGARDTVRETREAVRDARDEATDRPRYSEESRDRDRIRDDEVNSRSRTRDRNARNSRGDVRRTEDESDLDVRSSSRTSLDAGSIRAADIGLWFDHSSRDSLVISDVATSGAIAQLGFREGDRIVSIDDQRVTRESDFVTLLFDEYRDAEQVRVVVIRGGQEQVIEIRPSVLIEEYRYVDNDPLEHFGVILDDRYDDRLVVWRVVPRSPAFYAGIRAGDVLTSFRGQPLTTQQAFVSTVRDLEPGEIPLQVQRDGRTRQLRVDYPEFQARSERRVSLRPADVERASERREDRIEDRRNIRRENRAERADERPALEPAPGAAPVPAPVPARRPGLLPGRRAVTPPRG